MLQRCRLFIGPVALLSATLLASCAGPYVQNPTGVAFVDRFLAFLANPNVTYLLLVLGLLALIGELAAPGSVVPGVAGAIMLLLSLYGLLQLPTNWLGPVLMIAGVAMMLIDIKVPGIVLSVGGVIAFLIGSMLIFSPPWIEPQAAAPIARLNPWLIVGTTLGVGAFFTLGVAAAFRAQFSPLAAGRETMIGKTGIARQPLQPTGIVHVEGEEWTAENITDEEIPAGAHIRVVGFDGVRLRVERRPDNSERS